MMMMMRMTMMMMMVAGVVVKMDSDTYRSIINIQT
jgi:hypothetical protein